MKLLKCPNLNEYWGCWLSDKIRLETVLAVLGVHDFYIKASKCTFMETELEYLGHFISRDGVKVD